MNVAQTIFSREKGLKCYNHTGYDIALLRLKCYKEDVYNEIGEIDLSHDPIMACKFSNAPGHEHILAVSNEDGKVSLQNTAVRNQFSCIQAHSNAVFDIAWMPQESKLVSVSADRTATLWDVSGSRFDLVQQFHGNAFSIKSVDFRPQDKCVFATGAQHGSIMIWDTRANHTGGEPRPDSIILNSHELKIHNTKFSQSVTTLVFQDDENLISGSAGDGVIKAWDLRKAYSIHKKENIPKYTMNYGGKSSTYTGFTSMMIDPMGKTLYASCVDRTIYAYNILTYNPNPVAEYYGHGLENRSILTFYVKACLSPDGEYIASGSNDASAYIWKTSNPGLPVVKLCGHKNVVNCIAWCRDKETKIVTCSDDCFHRIWRVRPVLDFQDDSMNIFGWTEKYERTSLNLSPTGNTQCNEPVAENSSGSSACRPSSSILLSPSKRSNSDSATMQSSPTSGLPNFVVDGTAPHLLAYSPEKKSTSKVNGLNWLIALRKRKREDQKSESDESSLTVPKKGLKFKR